MSAYSRGAALLVFSALLSLSATVEIIHEKGRCIWKGECTADSCPPTANGQRYNFFYNGWHSNVTEESDPELYGLIKEVCPMYIDSNDTAHVCCTATQVKELKSNLEKAQSLISRCPACLSNFVKHYCITTCDFDASSYMNATVKSYNDTKTGEVYEYTHDVTFFLTEQYAQDLYNSCANVQFAGGGSHVMNLLCGGSNCSALAWLEFMGNPVRNGESPFFLHYKLYPNSSEVVDNITPLDDVGMRRFTPCNESVGDLGKCSCSDCPIVCPAPPTFSEGHFPFKIVAWSVGTVGAFLSTVIFIAALVSSFWVKIRYGGYQAISGEKRPPNSTYGAISTASNGRAAEKESSVTSSINSDTISANDGEEKLSALVRCCQSGHYIERTIKLIFYHWARFVAKFWYLVIIVTLIITAILSFGIYFFSVTTDPVKLWSSPHSRARLEKNYFDEHFGPFFRTEQIIVRAKNSVPGIVISTEGETWHLGSIYNLSVLEEVLHIQNHLATMPVHFDDGDENNSTITLEDICFSPLAPENKNCTIYSILNYFQNEESLLTQTINFLYNSSFHIHYCTRFPFSENETQYGFNIPCLGTFGGDIDPNVALGGFKANPDGNGYNYDTATVLIVTFVVNNHVNDEDNKMAMAWEKAFLDYLEDYKKNNATFIDFEYSAERSIIDEINRESETDIYTVAASYLLMFVYITICLGHIRSIKTIVVDMKLGVGFVGVLLVLFAVTSSLGFYSYFKLEGSLIILEVVPFLVLAVGVDNLFILVHSYERQVKMLAEKHGCNWDKIPVSEIIGRSVGDVAPSLLLTGLSETFAFLLGAISIMPAVRSFSLYAGTAVLFNLLLQLSVFVAVMTLDAMRQLNNRVDILPCLSLKGKFDPQLGYDFLSIIMKYFANFVLYWLVRPFILLFFGLTLTTSLILMFRIQIGLDQNLALPRDSYLLPYFDELFANLHTGSPVYFVIKDGINYTSNVTQNHICSSAGCLEDSLGNQITIYARAPNESGIAESPLNWLDSYFAWLSVDGGCCGYYNTSNLTDPVLCDHPENGTECVPCIMTNRPDPSEFRQFLKYFLAANPNATCASGGHAAFGHAVILANDNMSVITSYIMTYHDSLQTSSEFINALKRARELSANVTKFAGGELEVFPYSVFYVYYEQYLTIIPMMAENIGLALAGVFVVSLLLTGFNVGAAVTIIAIVISIILHMLGSMAVLGINANAVSLVNLVMTVGIAVEFCAHIVRWFVSCSLPTRTERAHSALHHMGASVFSGITVTKFLGVFVLLFAKSQLFEVYYFRMYMCMLLWGALHGLVLLPVVLSYIGPPYFLNTLSSPYNDKHLSNAPKVPENVDQHKPVHSYGNTAPPDPSAPPATIHDNSNQQQYPPATWPNRHTKSQDSSSFYPPLPNHQQYEPTTWSNPQLNEKSPLVS